MEEVEARQSGDFDDFNTISKQSRKLKYRGPKMNKTGRSVSRRKERKIPADFCEKLSEEFEERGVKRGNAFYENWQKKSNLGDLQETD